MADGDRQLDLVGEIGFEFESNHVDAPHGERMGKMGVISIAQLRETIGSPQAKVLMLVQAEIELGWKKGRVPFGELIELSGGDVKKLRDMEIEHDDASAKDVLVFFEWTVEHLLEGADP